MAEFYSTAEEVMQYTGVKPGDLGLNEEQELKDVLEGWLIQIKDIIDKDRNRNYHREGSEVPPGINHIAMRVCANVVAQASFRRESTIVQVDDYRIQMVDDQIFTEAIREDLSRYPRKMSFGMTIVKGGVN